MQTKITVIVDNISDRGMKGEWGLSIMAEVIICRESEKARI